MTKIASPWKRTAVTRNPYYRTAFRVGRVPREVVRYRTVSILISQTRQVIRTDPMAHTIQDKPVTEEELNDAEKILLKNETRILEELIEHPAERLPLDHLKSLELELRDSIQPAQALEDLEIRTEFLKGWLPELVDQALKDTGSPDGLLGALELELLPPFGKLTAA